MDVLTFMRAQRARLRGRNTESCQGKRGLIKAQRSVTLPVVHAGSLGMRVVSSVLDAWRGSS